MHPPLILRAEAGRCADLLHLHTILPVEFEASAKGTAIAPPSPPPSSSN